MAVALAAGAAAHRRTGVRLRLVEPRADRLDAAQLAERAQLVRLSVVVQVEHVCVWNGASRLTPIPVLVAQLVDRLGLQGGGRREEEVRQRTRRRSAVRFVYHHKRLLTQSPAVEFFVCRQKSQKPLDTALLISIPNILTTCDYAYGLIEIMDKSGRSKKR
jgi:hypothetical protein